MGDIGDVIKSADIFAAFKIASTCLCCKLGVSDAGICKWKLEYGGMDVSEARRLKSFEEESARLRRLLADTTLAEPLTTVGQDRTLHAKKGGTNEDS